MKTYIDKQKTIDMLTKLKTVYVKAAKKRLKEHNLQEAARLNWKKDAVQHAIQVVEMLEGEGLDQ